MSERSVPPKLAKLQAQSAAVRLGGKGTTRRKYKAVHKTAVHDDHKLQNQLKKLGVAPIGDIEEVNLIMDNETVIRFHNPKVQASIPSNLYVVSGANETKPVSEVMPSLYNQLTPEQLKQFGEAASAAIKGTEKVNHSQCECFCPVCTSSQAPP
eukprot:NODE_4081_length_844_cov_49.686792_g3379_i0.p1 GENE.NODE_4081_length_844_cov_49.686792_g3379_i0~~NODE_4081_length_844_cov_49.686792_g3379_i0.p1  ORF type:complete len:154 (+),score=43.32 NODE_4081_length_844_cov_49.686792_g3379_i0:101-562(+)